LEADFFPFFLYLGDNGGDVGGDNGGESGGKL
jgi:hypothetical protein